MIDIPNFSKMLKHELLPELLLKSKDYFKKCLDLLKGLHLINNYYFLGETLFFENGFSIEDIALELGIICIL